MPSSAPGFADGEPCPAPPAYRQPDGLEFHSLIIAGESLAARFAEAVRRGRLSAPTGRYGDLPLSLDPQGRPWPRSLDRLDLFDPATLRYLRDHVRGHVAAQVGGALGGRIRLWGLDNEWEGRANYSPVARDAFGRWLRAAYAGDIVGLNAAWGTAHGDFTEATAGPLPEDRDHRDSPGRFLDWWHFQSERFTSVLAGLARIARDADPLRRGVVHKATQLTLEMPAWRERLLDQARFADLVRPDSGGFYGIDMYGHGDRQVYETSYAYHCIRSPDRRPGHGVMLCENNNHNGPAGQFAATQWRLLANGLKGMMYFTTGYAGGAGDWDHFAFLDPATGRMKEKFFHAPRWANHVLRAGEFWANCAPAPGSPRVALLLPRRDVLLAEPSGRNPASPRYSYPRNHRWLFFRRLREQGYWVDVIPCTKLSAGYLGDYQALCLIGAEHLSADECAEIRAYASSGGVLVADARAGLYDEHHRPRHQLDDLLGVALPETSAEARAGFLIGGESVTVCELLSVRSLGAVPAEGAGPAEPPAYRHQAGRGVALYFPFEVGSLETGIGSACLASIKSDAATAESEEYAAFPGEFAIGRWLGGLLRACGLRPAYDLPAGREIARVEQPLTDGRGNVAVVVSTRAQTQPEEVIPEGPLTLPLPGGPWSAAFWAPAETDAFDPVAIRPDARPGYHRIELPEVATAGVVHLFRRHPPLLGVRPIEGRGRALDPHTAQVEPGVPFRVEVQLVAPASEAGAGELRLDAPAGWTVLPSCLETSPLPAGSMRTLVFTVTPAADHRAHRPDRLIPLSARWRGETGETAAAFSCVEVTADPARTPRLLTDNASFPATYPWRAGTGATYAYLSPSDPTLIADPAEGGEGGGALTNGFGSIGGQRHSHHRDLIGTGHIARYHSPQVDILFDLKAERDLMRVVLVTGAGPVYPTAVRVLVGRGDRNFEAVVSLVLEEPLLEIETPLFSARGRHVRVQVDWPSEGGTLDEVEIWGR